MFSIHMCSYKALLLDYWSTPIITVCCFNFSDCNKPLRMTHCLSNWSMSIILSITLVNTRDLSHCAAWEILPYIWKEKYYFLVEEFLDWWVKFSLELFLSWFCYYKFLGTCWTYTVIIFSWCLKRLSIIINSNVYN